MVFVCILVFNFGPYTIAFACTIAFARWPIFNVVSFLEYLERFFLHRTTLMFLQNGFSHDFGLFNFRFKLTILQRFQPSHGPQPLQDGRFSTWSHLSNIWYFYRAVVFTEEVCCSCSLGFRMFLSYLVFDPNRPFWKG